MARTRRASTASQAKWLAEFVIDCLTASGAKMHLPLSQQSEDASYMINELAPTFLQVWQHLSKTQRGKIAKQLRKAQK